MVTRVGARFWLVSHNLQPKGWGSDVPNFWYRLTYVHTVSYLAIKFANWAGRIVLWVSHAPIPMRWTRLREILEPAMYTSTPRLCIASDGKME